MPHRTKWLWEGYFLFMVILIAGKAYSFFAPHTPQYLYFKILYSFNPAFFIPYYLGFLQIVVNIFHCLPLGLYTWRIRLFKPRFWKCLFVLKVILDLTGHSYEMNTLISMYYASPQACALTVSFALIPHIPFYWACYAYAFRQKRILN